MSDSDSSRSDEPDQTTGSTANPVTASPLVGPRTVISFHYDLYDENEDKIESSEASEPLLFLYGQNTVLASLQEAFLNKSAGDDFTVTIPSGRAYGSYYPDRKQRIPIKQIDGGKKQRFRTGQVINLQGERGTHPGTIVKVGKFNVDVDANHPLAGKDLRFDVKIVKVRNATEEELAHGHAHGPGGHQH